jgi:CO/xanthine dehydrogenase Mo-binding subunit
VAAYLGGVADEVAVAQVDTFGPLALVTSGDSYTMNQKTQDAAARNPRWVPAISSATTASIGAHVGTHAAAEAARVMFRFGLWPAALELWGIAPTDPKAREWDPQRLRRTLSGKEVSIQVDHEHRGRGVGNFPEACQHMIAA